MSAGAVGGDVAVLVMRWLLRKRRKDAIPDQTTGRYLMPYSKPYQAITLAAGSLLAGFLVLGFFVLDTPREWAIYMSIFGALTLMAVTSIHEVFRSRLSFAEDGLYQQRGLGGSTIFLPWSSVTRAEYSSAWYWFTFRGADGQKIRVSVYRDGLATFAEFAARKLASGPAQNAPALLREKALTP